MCHTVNSLEADLVDRVASEINIRGINLHDSYSCSSENVLQIYSLKTFDNYFRNILV